MAEKAPQSRIHIELTPEQQEQVRKATGKTVVAINLTPEELEERVAPIGDTGGVKGLY